MHELRLDRPVDVTDLDLPWDMRRPKEGEASLRRLLLEVGTATPESAARSIEILTQIARAEALQGKASDAERTLIQAEKALPSVTALAPRLRILLERGRLLTAARTPMQARERFLEVWGLAKDVPSAAHFAIDAANMMSRIETPKKRNEWTLQALALAEQSHDPRAQRWRGVLFVSLGWHLLEQLQLPKAFEAFEKSVSCFREEGATLNTIIARSYIGRTMRMMHRIDEALSLQQELLLEMNREGVKDGTINEELAECLHALKRPTEAEVYFTRAYDLLSADAGLVDQEPSRLKRLKTLGRVKSANN